MARRTVLLIDDDPQVLDSLESLLSLAGWNVITADGAQPALDALTGRRVDVTLMDVVMPGVKGLSLLGDLQASQSMPIVVMSGHGTIDLAVRAMKEGAVDFLTKPFPPETLPAKLAQIVDQGGRTGREPRRPTGDVARSAALLGDSEVMAHLRERISKVGPVETTVLIVGETGTGKELVARALHAASPRTAGPFVAINCAALPGDLVEVTLFGHEKGAFTGADSDRPGKFEDAHGGTLFLDEVNLLPIEVQGKLLRVLQEREVERIGGRRPIRVDVRFLSATNGSLELAVGKGSFREDLYFRLAAFSIVLPRLADRGDDVVLLADTFGRDFAARIGRIYDGLTMRAAAKLMSHSWPGNVRELRNVVERSVLLSSSPRLDSFDIPNLAQRPPMDDVPIPSFDEQMLQHEKDYLHRLLEKVQGRIEEAADMAGLSYSTLRRKLLDHGLRREDYLTL